MTYILIMRRGKNMNLSFAAWFLSLFGFETRELRYARLYVMSKQSAQNAHYWN